MAVHTRPADIDDADVAAALSAGWGLRPTSLAYAPVGYGSHHWIADTPGARWFVSVDEPSSMLSVALATARSLLDNGLSFVVAPLATTDRELTQSVSERHVAALYPFIDGETHDFGPYQSNEERIAVTDRLADVHRVTGLGSVPNTDDLVIPKRRELQAALAHIDEAWSSGPFAHGAHASLRSRRAAIVDALSRYDKLAVDVSARTAASKRLVVTHGEPHRGNTIDTVGGVMLIDWDTVLLAPPERDLWMLMAEDRAMADYYQAKTGTVVDEAAIELYTLRWDLTEIALFVDDLRRPHLDCEDTRVARRELARYLAEDRWL